MTERAPSVAEIAAHLGGNPDTICKWTTRKSLPAHKLGRLWKFLASEVHQWVKDCLTAPEPTDVDLPKGAKRGSTKKLG